MFSPRLLTPFSPRNGLGLARKIESLAPVERTVVFPQGYQRGTTPALSSDVGEGLEN